MGYVNGVSSEYTAHLENDLLRIELLPNLGGKVISFYYKPAAKELLYRSPDRSFRSPCFGDLWTNYDMSGFDECFPTIAACNYPAEPFNGVRVVDHGELWSQSWECSASAQEIKLNAKGILFPYTFEKSLRLTGQKLVINYKLTNLSAREWQYLWSAHPVFRLTGQVHLDLPEGTSIFVEGATNDDFVLNEPTLWPKVKTKKSGDLNLSHIEPRDLNQAIKVFAGPLAKGDMALVSEDDGILTSLSFSTESVPYLGIWINQGGIPPKMPQYQCLGLEPTTSPTDFLDKAINKGLAFTLGAYETKTWNLALTISRIE